MYSAIYNNEKIEISSFVDTMKGGLFCPCCNSEVIAKQGASKAHHFAHKTLIVCDQWYEMSEWHRCWQEQFNEKYREVVMNVGEEKHRADIKVNHLVVEFQNSPISVEGFEERNRFYTANGDMLVWLFNGEDKLISTLDSVGKMKWKYKTRLKVDNRIDNVRCFIEKSGYIYSLQNFPCYGYRMIKEEFMSLLRDIYKTKNYNTVDKLKYKVEQTQYVKHETLIVNRFVQQLHKNGKSFSSVSSIKSVLKGIKL